MATKKTAAAKLAATVSPEPEQQDDGGACPMPTPEDAPADVFVPDAIEIGADAPEPVVPTSRAVTPAGSGTGTAPAPAAGITTPGAGGAQMASTIPVVVGTAGYYTGARRAETKAEYQARLGSVYGTFGDLGWILGTSPRT